MPGRQAHGRSLTSQPKPKKGGKHSKARSQQNALNAFGIAQEQFPTREKRTPRFRELDADIERKHGRDEDDDEDEEDEEEQPRRKRVKGRAPANDDDAEYGSDSEGNEWRLGGLAEDDEDSEIESDDAFGESDDDKFDGYTFRGSKSAHNRDDDSEDDSNDDEGETLGEEAIDLATALDQWEEGSDDEAEADGESESGSDSDDSDESDKDEESDHESDHEADPEQLEALRGLVSGFGGDEDGDKDKTSTKQKIKIGDLGLSGLDDVFMKNSLKLMSKEQKEKRPGATKKLDVPLSRREQGRLDRSAAYEKTNETLDRWKDTVKHHWEAEHVSFPLLQNNNKVGLDTTEIQPLTAQNASNELESTILSIMDQSGLTMEKPKKEKQKVYDEDGNELTRKEIVNRRRMERELQEREAKRAKRIKKIKSKAYHRVHRKQRERDEMAEHQARAEAGEIDSEEEREAQDRRRALERVGARHKESKWAKMGSKNKRAVWDDDFRAGLTEMARKDEELRRRVEGKRADSDDDTSSSGSDSEDDDATIRRQLGELEAGFDEPQKGVMGMKFMRKAEEAKRQEIADLRKQFEDEDGNGGADDSAEEAGEVGRRQYGAASSVAAAPALDTSNRAPRKRRDADDETNGAGGVVLSNNASGLSNGTTNGDAWCAPANTAAANATEGAWTSAAPRKKKGTSNPKMEALDITSTVTVIPQSSAKANKSRKSASRTAATNNRDTGGDSDSETDQHLPLAIRDQELLEKAFAGDDVEAEFEREKDEVAEADDDKIVDNTLPGWGSWVGEGVSSREKKRHQGRFLTKVEGIKKKDRKDAKLDRVIINEKRIKKNERYLASQLPYPFETRAQYERSLRLPVGPEWQTKETFQDSTKPRVLLKQGVIAPISKPTR
ncbi:hypothetical protein ACRE_037860 [Hapsidospora chrysogenum ATCC 11550]|uniref:Uncharacterized protein n=1 Tax=Hapsidospora chrysogenum (strain ATCC 11550 / CBS 779.69 / DSM 880 / IAM 14645 / JCM 23072 / IMI 49137) TaxID=857340 RepID=A0A086T7W9_HAPC1|nr:hypothetical protein ACRE_037860 [Hapsidospora chrysogenum ATCC 11550]